MTQNNPVSQELNLDTEKKTLRQRLCSLFVEYRYLLLAFIIPVFLMYLLYVSIGIYPFGDRTVLGLDLNAQYVDFYYGLRNILHGDADALYTFARSLGGEFMGIYAYYVASPFAFIVALFPRTMMAHAIFTIFLLKTGLCGFTFGFYLHKTSKFKNKISIVGFSILYALSSYAIVQQHNNMWIDALVWLPIITYGIEQLIKFGKFRIFVIFLSLTIISNFYIGYMMCFYVVIYFFFYYFAHSKEVINPTGENRHFIKSFGRFAGFSLLAAAISAIIILTAYYSLTFGKTTFSETVWFDGVKFNLFEIIPKLFTGSYDTVRNSGLPLIYCGIVTVLLVPMYFCSKQFKLREKIASICLILVFVLSFWISDLDLIWHGMQKPNWLPYRYSFMLTFVLLVLAFKAFSDIRNTKSNVVFTVAFCVEIAVVICGTAGLEHFHPLAGFLLSALLVAGFALLLIFMIRKPEKRKLLTFAMVGVICIETVINGVYTIHAANSDALSFTSYSRFTTYFENIYEVSDALKEYDGSFYRMENLGTRDSIKKNDGMAIGMRGIAGSTSTLNAKTILLLHNIGYRAASHLSYYSGRCNVNDSLLGIKYVLSKPGETQKTINGYLNNYKEITLDNYDGEYQVFENPYALSFAYAVSSDYADLNLSESKEYPVDNLNALVASMLGDPDYTVFDPIELSGDISVGSALKISRATTYSKYSIDDSSASADNKSVVFTYIIPESADGEQLYFYMPYTAYQRAVDVSVKVGDGKYYSLINGYGNDSYYILPIGTFSAGDTVSVKFVINNSYNNLWLRTNADGSLPYSGLYSLDSEKYSNAMLTLQSGAQLEIDDSSTDAHIHGVINGVDNDNQLIFTSIPYDAGWNVTVDGEKVDIYESKDSLLYFYVDSGDHTVSLDYSPSCFRNGLIISIAGVAVFAALCVIITICHRKKRNCPILECNNADSTDDCYFDEHIYDITDDKSHKKYHHKKNKRK